MENMRILELLDRFTSSTCTPAEMEELMQLLNSSYYDVLVKNYIGNEWGKHKLPYQLTGQQSQSILSAIRSSDKSLDGVIQMPVKSRKWYAVAAAAILILALGSLTYFMPFTSSEKTVAAKSSSSQFKNDVAPGMDGAVLTLADGSVIVLDSAADGNISSQGSSHIVKSGGSVQYVLKGGINNGASGFNTIVTPRGRHFQLILEDGSQVWLNAASSIRFPAVFDKKERHVEITGEAYFEIAKDAKRGFTVAVNGAQVQVLGTNFNVNAYADEASMETTLLEGSVKVINNNNARLLAPGQQATVAGNGNLTVLNGINTDNIIAWKNDLFSFNNTDIKTLMRQLSRWYDIDIIMPQDVGPITFTGDISRNAHLTDVLKMLELTDELAFSINGKKVTVTF